MITKFVNVYETNNAVIVSSEFHDTNDEAEQAAHKFIDSGEVRNTSYIGAIAVVMYDLLHKKINEVKARKPTYD